MLDHGILSLLIQQIIAEFQLTDTQASLLLGPAFASIDVLVGIPLSPLIVRRARTKIIAIGITVWSLATAPAVLRAIPSSCSSHGWSPAQSPASVGTPTGATWSG